jgi:predicted outer membrane repeat protein
MSYAFQFITNHDDTYPAADTLTHDSEMVTRYEYYTVAGKDAGLIKLYSHTATIKAFPVEGSYTWLQDKIDKNDQYVLDRNVTFNPDYDLSEYNRYYNVINFVNGMLINKTFTLDGNGYTINGINKARIFTITANDVTIENTNVINGSSTVNGGAFYINSGVSGLTISKCSFENNNAKGTGGAVYANGNGQNIKIADSLFNANSAYGGGAVQFAAGSAYYNNIDIINSNFTNTYNFRVFCEFFNCFN